jgi:ubiquinone biosynthesis protein
MLKLSIRKIGVISRTYRHLNRYQQILRILFKYGFQEFVEGLGIEQYIEIGMQLISRQRREQIENHTTAERVRLAIEELGPTFVKLGQILSTRPDLIPLEYVKELAKLQDKVPSFPYEEVREIIKKETGQYPEDIFERFDKETIAAGSIGQVHKARLRDGDDVVVKVQRPRIHKMIEVDLEIMLHLATLMERHLEEVEVHQPTRIVEEFARTIEKEIDYLTEASHVDRFSRLFLADDTVYVPKIYHALCTERILTLEYIDGIKASDLDRIHEEGYDPKLLAERGALLILKQIFQHGFFHADPHPGNVFFLPNNIICYIDFGMMGRINRQDQEDFADLVMAVAERDEKKAGNALLKITSFKKEPDRRELDRDLADFMERHLFQPLQNLEVGKLLQQLLEIVTKYGIQLKPEFFILMKALSSVEGIGKELDPDFEIVTYTEPFIRRIQMNRLNPRRIFMDMVDSGSEFVTLLKQLPRDLQVIFRLAKEGRLKIEFEHQGLEPLLFALDRISNRIAFSIVLASLIVASSLIILSGIPPKWHEIPIVGLTGFLVAALMGFWLLVSILRHGRM